MFVLTIISGSGYSTIELRRGKDYMIDRVHNRGGLPVFTVIKMCAKLYFRKRHAK